MASMWCLEAFGFANVGIKNASSANLCINLFSACLCNFLSAEEFWAQHLQNWGHGAISHGVIGTLSFS